MKSFCLSLINLYTLRELLPSAPTSVDASGRPKGYSGPDLASLDEVCAAIDAQIGAYRKARRALGQALERKTRAIHRIADRVERQYQEQLANNEAVDALEALDVEKAVDQLGVVSLEDAEAKWLQDNWTQRTDWNGADEARARIRAITLALTDDNLISWKAGEKEPNTADFDRPKASAPTPLHPNGHAAAAELSATVAG